MNQHTRFNLPLCLAVEEDAFSHADEIIANYLDVVYIGEAETNVNIMLDTVSSVSCLVVFY